MHTKNSFTEPLLTDFYQITMAFAFWKAGKASDQAVFELFFRKNPFEGEFTIFAGLNECLKFLHNFKFSDEDIAYIRTVLHCKADDLEPFLAFLSAIDLSKVTIWAIDEGTVVFPNVPLLIIRGPLIVCQLLETNLLNLVNFASLVTTNAVRIRMASGESKKLLEFGLRRAQGPNGGLSASLYSYIGGFDGTSNVLAGKIYGIPLYGSHAHSFVSSFPPIQCRKDIADDPPIETEVPCSLELTVEALTASSQKWLCRLQTVLNFSFDQVKTNELRAFIHLAVAFPNAFLGLVDTYSVVKSGLPCFCAVALGLHSFGFRAKGIRIDSGDLAYFSIVCRTAFAEIATHFDLPWFKDLNITASNDLNEDTIHCLNQQEHSIDVFGVGTNLVTCQKQPALGCVYKLVQVNSLPTAKLSEDWRKSTIPGQKVAYRLFGHDGIALLDLLQSSHEEPPKVGSRVLCRHACQSTKFVHVEPSEVRPLHSIVWNEDSGSDSKTTMLKSVVPLTELRARVRRSLKELRGDHKRHMNPTPYKVSLSDPLYHMTQAAWLSLSPKLILS